MADKFGTNGNDVINGTAEADFISGGPQGGDPALEIGDDEINGDGGNDTILGLGGNDTLTGGEGSDTIEGGAGEDELYGGTDDDTMLGGDGSDVFHGGAGNDTFDGQGDFDDVWYAGEGGLLGVTVDLAAGTATDTFGDADTLTSISGIAGSDLADTLLGDGENNIIRSFRGNDIVDGRDGSDEVHYANDQNLISVTVDLATGTALELYGDGTSTDTLVGIERIRGSLGGDSLTGDGANNTIRGIAGDDWIDGAGGRDMADYSQDARYGGNQGVTVDLGTGSAIDGFGDTDTLTSIEDVRGTRFGDTVYGGDQSFSQYQMGAGSDFVDGGDGGDAIDYSRDNDGTASHGVFVNLSDAEQTSFLGTAGPGTAIDLYGDTDTLQNIEDIIGSEFADVLVGDGEGYEGFQGLGGDDILTGGSGDSWAYYDQDIHHGGSSGVTVNLSDQAQGGQAANSATDGFGDTDTLVNINKVRGTQFADTVYGGDQSFSQFQMGAGGDVVDGGDGEDAIDYSRDNEEGTATHGVFVNLSDAEQTSFLGTAGPGTAIDLYGDTDTLQNIEDIIGSEFADVLVGDGEGYEGFQGLGGDDILTGGSGDSWAYYDQDIHHGGSSGVTVNLSDQAQGGQAANSATDGFGDTDTLVNINKVRGTQFADTVYGGDQSFSQFQMGAGGDVVDGGDG
ncbi:calcium-binding protein, partial [Mesorhizobium sp. IMUNJ 23033]|uniref:calcium-binding protein n=1 Tax=Mesorhizobium sp. IMUNJ 23033 TaxID=3378039 RepID=UPI00384EF7BE